MALEWCKSCRTHHWDRDLCRAQEFVCRLAESDDDDCESIHARDAEMAAGRFLEFCQSHRDGWEWIKPDSTHEVVVTPSAEPQTEKRFRVTAYLEWSYIALEAQSPQATELANG